MNINITSKISPVFLNLQIINVKVSSDLLEEQKKLASGAVERLLKFGYCKHCALDGASSLLRLRFVELV